MFISQNHSIIDKTHFWVYLLFMTVFKCIKFRTNMIVGTKLWLHKLYKFVELKNNCNIFIFLDDSNNDYNHIQKCAEFIFNLRDNSFKIASKQRPNLKTGFFFYFIKYSDYRFIMRPVKYRCNYGKKVNLTGFYLFIYFLRYFTKKIWTA